MKLFLKLLNNFALVGLITAGTSSVINLLGLILLEYILAPELLAEIRNYLNLCIYIGILLCFGWDTLIVKLKANTAGTLVKYFFYSQVAITVIGLPFTTQNWTFINIFLISLLIAFPTLNYNALRPNKKYLLYFIGLNIIDKIFRFFAILISVNLNLQNFPQNLILALFFLNFLNYFIFRRQSNKISNDITRAQSINEIISVFKSSTYINTLLASLSMMILVRGLYFAIPIDLVITKNTLDFTALFASFLFIPVQSLLKVKETEKYQKRSIIKVSLSEYSGTKFILLEILLIILLMASFVLFSFHIKFQPHIEYVTLVFVSFIVFTTYPSLLQLLVHDENRSLYLWSLSFLLCSVISYFYIFRNPHVVVYIQSFLLIYYVFLLSLFAIHRDELIFLVKRLFRSFLMIVVVIISGIILL